MLIFLVRAEILSLITRCFSHFALGVTRQGNSPPGYFLVARECSHGPEKGVRVDNFRAWRAGFLARTVGIGGNAGKREEVQDGCQGAVLDREERGHAGLQGVPERYFRK